MVALVILKLPRAKLVITSSFQAGFAVVCFVADCFLSSVLVSWKVEATNQEEKKSSLTARYISHTRRRTLTEHLSYAGWLVSLALCCLFVDNSLANDEMQLFFTAV